MTSIRQVVEQHVGPDRMSYAGQALRALESREQRAVQVIRQRAQRAGLSTEQVNETLIEAGLVERPRPVQPARQAAQGRTAADRITLEGVAATLERVERRLDTAARAAERHGIRF